MGDSVAQETKKVPNVTVEVFNSRLRIRINGQVHLSLPYREENFKMIVKSYIIGKQQFCKIEYMLEGRTVVGQYKREVFDQILSGLEEKGII